ncbi:MAG: hypothetical protein HN553_04170 [Opitutae bacterium]|jgi:hypothetical protein|nr:hypothetical protein [Opitutae bacterium]
MSTNERTPYPGKTRILSSYFAGGSTPLRVIWELKNSYEVTMEIIKILEIGPPKNI